MIRLIDEEGKMLGLFQVPDAVKIAHEKGLDLIEISPDSNPPTCKIMDFGKYKYQLKKKAAESKKKQVNIVVKEIQFRPNTDQHDVDYKVNHIKEFLKEGNKCRIVVTFRGREMAHQDLGKALLNKIVAMLGTDCVIEQSALMEGKKLGLLVGPAASTKAQKPKPAAAPAQGVQKTSEAPAPATPRVGGEQK